MRKQLIRDSSGGVGVVHSCVFSGNEREGHRKYFIEHLRGFFSEGLAIFVLQKSQDEFTIISAISSDNNLTIKTLS